MEIDAANQFFIAIRKNRMVTNEILFTVSFIFTSLIQKKMTVCFVTNSSITGMFKTVPEIG